MKMNIKVDFFDDELIEDIAMDSGCFSDDVRKVVHSIFSGDSIKIYTNLLAKMCGVDNGSGHHPSIIKIGKRYFTSSFSAPYTHHVPYIIGEVILRFDDKCYYISDCDTEHLCELRCWELSRDFKNAKRDTPSLISMVMSMASESDVNLMKKSGLV